MAEPGFAESSEAEQRLLPPERSRSAAWPWVLAAIALVVVLLARLALQSAGGPPEARGENHPAVGANLTTFHLEPLTGESRQVSEADLQGKVTLVNFWGPWCGACAVEFPHLVELEKHFRSHPDFQFFSVSSNFNPLDETDLAEGTAAFLKQQRAEFPTYRDPRAHTRMGVVNAAKLEAFAYPATLLLDRAGVIRGLWIGYAPADETAVRKAIESALRKEGKQSYERSPSLEN
jgi:cytochrome c biogenesis protein CcmG, thiol:disulfide interchange protein DsbE